MCGILWAFCYGFFLWNSSMDLSSEFLHQDFIQRRPTVWLEFHHQDCVEGFLRRRISPRDSSEDYIIHFRLFSDGVGVLHQGNFQQSFSITASSRILLPDSKQDSQLGSQLDSRPHYWRIDTRRWGIQMTVAEPFGWNSINMEVPTRVHDATKSRQSRLKKNKDKITFNPIHLETVRLPKFLIRFPFSLFVWSLLGFFVSFIVIFFIFFFLLLLLWQTFPCVLTPASPNSINSPKGEGWKKGEGGGSGRGGEVGHMFLIAPSKCLILGILVIRGSRAATCFSSWLFSVCLSVCLSIFESVFLALFTSVLLWRQDIRKPSGPEMYSESILPTRWIILCSISGGGRGREGEGGGSLVKKTRASIPHPNWEIHRRENLPRGNFRGRSCGTRRRVPQDFR